MLLASGCWWLALVATLQEAAPAKLPTLAVEEFGARRKELLRRSGGRPVLVPCEKLTAGEPGIDSNTPLFDFDYLVGWRQDGAVLAVTEEGSILFAEGAGPAGVEKVLAPDRLEAFVKEVYREGETAWLHFMGGAASRRVRGLLEAAAVARSSESRRQLLEMRSIKSEAEKEMMRAVTRQTNAGQWAALMTARPGLNERELQKAIEDAFNAHGATGLGFPSIVAAGKNATILHYMENKEPIGEHVLIVLDIGSGYHGYSSDVTRTIPSDGTFDGAEREIYACVLEAQKAAEAILKPGVTWRQLDQAARKVIEERALTKWSYAHSADDHVRHSLGHYVGLSVHDSGPGSGGLRAGMCITIEPGIYDKDLGIGVRIEDIYLVTEEGFERLSAPAPREIAEIEKAMKR